MLLIISGTLGLITATFYLSMGERLVSMGERTVEQSLERINTLLSDSEPGQISPEQQALLQEGLAFLQAELAVLEAVRTTMRSPLRQMFSVLAALLSLVALVAGVGLLTRQRWAPQVVVWQAGCSFMLRLSTIFVSPERGMNEAVLQMLDPNSQEMVMLQTSQTIGQWLGWILLLVWNGLIIWYFTRPSIKAQFVQQK